jgi:hypothetical protein
MVARSISGGGSTRTHIMTRSKAHFFKSLDLTDVITPADDTPGTFTGVHGREARGAAHASSARALPTHSSTSQHPAAPTAAMRTFTQAPS